MNARRRACIRLFPLCDAAGIMNAALIQTVEDEVSSKTRPDAVVFAWLLELPQEMDSAEAARAVLFTLRASAPRELSRNQRLIVAELQKIIRVASASRYPLRRSNSRRTVIPTLNSRRRGQGAQSNKPKLRVIAGGRVMKDGASAKNPDIHLG